MKLKRIIGVVLMAIVLLNGMFFASENKVYAAEIEAGIDEIAQEDMTKFMNAFSAQTHVGKLNANGDNEYLYVSFPERVSFTNNEGNTVYVPLSVDYTVRGDVVKIGNILDRNGRNLAIGLSSLESSTVVDSISSKMWDIDQYNINKDNNDGNYNTHQVIFSVGNEELEKIEREGFQIILNDIDNGVDYYGEKKPANQQQGDSENVNEGQNNPNQIEDMGNYATQQTPTQQTPTQQSNSLMTGNPLEMTLSEVGLTVGDYLLEYLTFLVKEEVTIEKIIFNRVDALNANFFDRLSNRTTSTPSKFIHDAINYWYDFLGKVVIVIYLMLLVVIGIMMMLDNPQKKVKARELFKKWTIGIAIFYFFPYAIRYAFEINNTLVGLVENQFGGSTIELGGYIGSVSDLREEDLEYRSPEYVSATTYMLKFGTKEANEAYITRLEDYRDKGDTLRIMRALAGISGKLIYVILWFIMIWQLLVFLYIYYKRYLMIAFLLAIFPITLIQYMIGNIASGKQSAISSWCKEFFINLFLQSIHAVIYGIISGVIMSQIVAAIRNGNPYNINWFLMLCAINFIFTGERVLRSIINAGMTASSQPAGDVSHSAREGIRGRFRSDRAHVARMINRLGR